MAASFETLRSLIYSSITNTGYVAVGTPFANPCHAFRLVNATDGDVFFSDDGVNPKWFVPAGSFVLYDVQSDGQPNKVFLYPSGTQISVKYSSAPGKNSVYVETMFSTVPSY